MAARRFLKSQQFRDYEAPTIHEALEDWRLESSGRRALGLDGAGLPDDDVYVEKVAAILTSPPFIGVPPRPSAIYKGNVFLGTQANAENLDLISGMRFTHILNCAGLPTTLRHARERRYQGTGVKYEEFPIDDSEYAPLSRFYDRAHNFINNGQMYGKVLIHCTGVSRSGAIAISYLMRHGCQQLLSAVQTVKDTRRVALCNTGFMHQLVAYAREQRMLDPDPSLCLASKYGGERDRRRLMYIHY